VVMQAVQSRGFESAWTIVVPAAACSTGLPEPGHC